MVKRGATAIAPHAVRRLEDRTRGLTRNVCSPTQSRHSTSREADIYRPLLDGLRKVAASLRTHRCKSHDIENAEQKQIVLLGRDRLRSKRWHGLPAFLHRLDPEPDGIQGRQKHEGEHCSAERSSDQGICERSPKNRMRERNESEHRGERGENYRTRALDCRFDHGIKRRQSVFLVRSYLSDQDERVTHEYP